tara:strand:+ start:147 stop:284 length:138 start_codon:yes stop_codon:yes gene_type:complete
MRCCIPNEFSRPLLKISSPLTLALAATREKREEKERRIEKRKRGE